MIIIDLTRDPMRSDTLSVADVEASRRDPEKEVREGRSTKKVARDLEIQGSRRGRNARCTVGIIRCNKDSIIFAV